MKRNLNLGTFLEVAQEDTSAQIWVRGRMEPGAYSAKAGVKLIFWGFLRLDPPNLLRNLRSLTVKIVGICGSNSREVLE